MKRLPSTLFILALLAMSFLSVPALAQGDEKADVRDESDRPQYDAQRERSRANYGLARRLESFGAVGDYDIKREAGTDDSDAIEAALNWWARQEGATLEIGTGCYQITRPLRIHFNGNNTRLGRIVGLGGWLQNRVSSISGTGTIRIKGLTVHGTKTAFLSQLHPADQIVVNGTAYSIRKVVDDDTALILAQNSTGNHKEPEGSSFVVWPPAILLHSHGSNRRPDIDYLKIRGHPSVTAGSNLAIYAEDGAGKTWDGFQMRSYVSQGFSNTALEIGPGVFECNFDSLEIGGKDGGSRDCIRVLQGSGGDISSIHFWAPNIRGGSIGLLSTVGDLHLVGGTAINAKFYGVQLNNFNGSVDGFHVENNFFGSPAAEGQAGMDLIVIRSCGVSNIYGTHTSISGQKHVLRIYSRNNLSVTGGANGSAIKGDTYAFVETAGQGHVFFNGTASVTDAGGANYTVLSGGRFSPPVYRWRGNSCAFAATVTPHLQSGPRIVVTGIAGAFTLADMEGLAPSSGDEIILELTPEPVGGYAVKFGPSYVTTSEVTTQANKTTLIRFMFTTAGKWQEESRSAN